MFKTQKDGRKLNSVCRAFSWVFISWWLWRQQPITKISIATFLWCNVKI